MSTTRLRDRYDEYAVEFITDGMEPMTYEQWLQAQFKDREMWERYQPCRKCARTPAHHVDLHAEHDWTNVLCPAYASLDGGDCRCGGANDE